MQNQALPVPALGWAGWEKQQTELLSAEPSSTHFSCIVGFSRSGKLFKKKYLPQIEHLLDMMEK